MKRALVAVLCLFCLIIFSPTAAFAEKSKCNKVEIMLENIESGMMWALKLSGSPPQIHDPADGTLRCPTNIEMINFVLKIFPGYTLREFREFSYPDRGFFDK